MGVARVVRLIERAAAAGDEAGLPHRLCQAMCESLGMDGASMSLMTHTEARQLLCASGDEALRLEELQYESGEGPCMASSESGSPVICADPAEHLTEWPIFGARWREELPGVALVLALPLTPTGATKPIGSVDLFRHTSWRPDAAQMTQALAAARSVTDILLRRALRHFGGADPLPWEPVEVIDAHWGKARQAAGRLAARRNIAVPDALALLRARAFATGRPLPQVCADLFDDPAD
ncbi:GAF domain-containing protein [Streptomyces sp. NPDC046939]|uniref:GAF domain-containing protein n=1 Tax=Streptomyces sp. NPDC046939 TaxID=3155376 RepID=UPI003408AD7C